MRVLPSLLAGAALLVSCTTSSATSADSVSVDPLAARPFYVDPASPAHEVLRVRPDDSAAVVLAGVPQARWFTDDTETGDIRQSVSAYVAGATTMNAMPVLVLYAIPGRDCGGFSAGGLADATAYAGWIRQVRAGIGGRPATVVVEPDALTAADCLGVDGREVRYGMLADAVEQLGLDATTVVYLDAGHSRWLSPAELARRLIAAGVDDARGFSLNVSNFFTTAEEQSYGEQVSALLGGAHYVVDVSRNGLGPAPDGPLNWCNPEGRAVGLAPSASTGAAHDDADLWIKNPGQSDGDCGRGEPRSGLWFPEQAASMVRLGGR